MIYLDKTTRKLEIVLGGAHTTTAPQATVCYFDVPQQQKTDFSAYQGATYIATSNGSTDVTICPAPSVNGTVRNIEHISIAQRDTLAATITVKIDDGGSESPMFSQSVSAGKTVVYEHGAGWSVV